MQISKIFVGRDRVTVTVDQEGASLELDYSGTVAHSLRVDRDGFVSLHLTVSPSTRSGDKGSRRFNRAHLDD